MNIVHSTTIQIKSVIDNINKTDNDFSAYWSQIHDMHSSSYNLLCFWLQFGRRIYMCVSLSFSVHVFLSFFMHTYTLTCASVFLVGSSECTCLCKSVYIPTQFLGTYHCPIPSILPTGLVVPFIPIFIHMSPYPAIYSLLGTFLRTAGAIRWQDSSTTYNPSTGMRVKSKDIFDKLTQVNQIITYQL